MGICGSTESGSPAPKWGAAAIADAGTDPFDNLLLLTDSYKLTHHLQYPPGTEIVYSYFESRGGQFDYTVFFGLQYFIKRYLVGPVVTKAKIEEAAAFAEKHYDHPGCTYNKRIFHREGWEYILKQYGGHLPIKIKAVPEGTVVPTRNALFTLENTDPKCFWLTNYLETLLVQVWYPMTVCTQSREMTKIAKKYLMETGCPGVGNPGDLQWILTMNSVIDFGFRGVSSVESAGLGGAAHLVNQMGSDTVAGNTLLRVYYGEEMAGNSIAAAEHSTITSWGKEKEVDAFRNMLTQFAGGLVAVVSDSYNIYDACEKLWGGELKATVEARKGILKVRPDSGKLPDVVLDVLDKLESKFGSSKSSTGHKMLPPCISVIQGDGIDINSMEEILKAMAAKGWAASNVNFGSGGALLQKLNRDTQKCAFKCSYAKTGAGDVMVFKDPITDPGKQSKKGRLTLQKDAASGYVTITEGKGDAAADCMVEVFNNGKLLVDDDLASIRKRAGLAPEDVPVKKVEVTKPTPDPFNNIITLTDSYKFTHHKQYPPNTKIIYSYFESRGGQFEDVCFFGLQYFLKRYLCGQVVTREKIEEGAKFAEKHFDHPDCTYNNDIFHRKGWEYILNKYGGKLPISIKSVPEGTVVPYKNVLFTLENLDEECFWLTNYLETLLVQVWYPTTVCTQSREMTKIAQKWLKATGCEEAMKKFALDKFSVIDFGFRGVSSVESAGTGGCAHLVNQMGSDTVAGVTLAKKYYSEEMAGFSIAAAEHSTITSWGRDKEVEAFRNMLTQFDGGMVAVVSDSYNIYDACEKLWGGELKATVEARKGLLKVRPDSGKLPDVVLDVLEKLGSKFGTSQTSTGHKMLPPCINVIQGDGVDIKSMDMILEEMSKKGWAAGNINFGSGGALLQKLHRDTQKCAFKCSYAKVGDEEVMVFKDPITDPGKQSKKGKLELDCTNGKYTTMTEGNKASNNVLVEVFRHGELLVDDTLAKIRERAAIA
jgi:nicotinamide phosphoribosyltransferase